MTTAHVNGNGNAPHRPWANGPSVPLTTPFKEDESIDHEALAKQVVRLAQAGVGIVLLGTNGEASHLTPAERKAAVVTARKALDSNGFQNEPLMVGTGGGSAAITIELTKEAAEAGATHSIVICPGYFSFAMGRDRVAILNFFKKVMDASPIPVLIYNFPGAASGIDLNSDELIELSEHPMCLGAKYYMRSWRTRVRFAHAQLTCAMIGKGHRLAAHTQSADYLSRHGARLQAATVTGQFQVLPGFSESLLPALVSRHTGCITGTGNIFPKTIRRLYDCAVAGLKGDAKALGEAMALQDRIARSDFIIVKAGVAGTKYALDHYVEKGLGGYIRSPLSPVTDGIKKMIDSELAEDWKFEQSL